MRRITCDKCGNVSTEIFACKYVENLNKAEGYDEYDLCEKCSKEWDTFEDEAFFKWLKGEE